MIGYRFLRQPLLWEWKLIYSFTFGSDCFLGEEAQDCFEQFYWVVQYSLLFLFVFEVRRSDQTLK